MSCHRPLAVVSGWVAVHVVTYETEHVKEIFAQRREEEESCIAFRQKNRRGQGMSDDGAMIARIIPKPREGKQEGYVERDCDRDLERGT